MASDGALLAINHPVRARVLAVLEEREASPKDLAELLDEKLGNVSYHVRTLHGADLIELVRTVPRRGAVEHYYRARASQGKTLSLELRLTKAGWNDVDEALEKLDKKLARLQRKHPGAQTARLVGVVDRRA